MASDPFADPLSTSYAQETAAESTTPGVATYSSNDLLAEPFSGGGWAGHEREEHGASATAGWGDAVVERGETGAHAAQGRGNAREQDDDEEEETFSYPTSSDPPPSSDETKPLRSSLRADAPSFAPSFVPSPAEPIEMPAGPASSLRRSRSSSTSGLLPASSVTPRATDSPLSRRISLEPSVDETPSTPPAASPPSPEKSSPPQPFSSLDVRPHPTRTPSTASSSKGYDPTVLRNLITSACSAGDIERLKSLIQTHSADSGDESAPSAFTLANQTSSHTGLAPLHYAAQKGHVEVVQWLIEQAGAMPELEDGDGETPLHKASLRGHLDVCRFLVSRGVDIDAQDADGWTALHNASSRGWLDVARLLVSAGGSIDKPSKRAYTALMNAASKGQLPLVHYLLKQGAKPLLRNSFGETAYDLAASVFEVQICTVLAAAESAAYMGEDSTRDPYNPLDLHSTVPVVLFENQRLGLPTLKKLSSLAQVANGPRWSSKALSRNDARAAFSMPPFPGVESKEPELPCFRSEVGLPVVGTEGELVLPDQGEIRSGGRVQVKENTPRPSSRASKSRTPRPSTSRRSSAASTSLNAVLSSSSSSSTPLSPSTDPSNTTTPSATHGEPAWIWLSDWVVNTTSPSSSPVDGWSYASSFNAPSDEWTPEPPIEVRRAMEGGPGLALSGKKWVRRRQWVRVMRRRVDLPAWGFADLPPFPRRPNFSRRPSASSAVEADAAPSSTADYRARAQFLAGNPHPLLAAGNVADRASIHSALTVTADSPPDRAELRKALARLERAADELRRGMMTDDDPDSRHKAEEELEAFLAQVALVRAELGSDELEDEGDSDEEFLYDGRDAGDDDDARSIWTSARPPSITSTADAGPSSSAAANPDYFTQPLLLHQHDEDDESSRYPDLTPQLARAPDFRVPTHETAPTFFGGNNGPFQPRPVRPAWEPDESTSECRRCSKRFTLFNRKHHCRRCGFVVCAACSPHSDQLDPHTVALEPGTFGDDQPWLTGIPALYRTCNDCHAALSLPQGLAFASSLLSPQAFFPASPSLGTVTPSEAAASDASELVECPVCGTTLGQLGDKAAQEGHIRDCLERGAGSIASGRYLVFNLPQGPLVGEECRICFEEFEVEDKVARLQCLCTFHQVCISSWLNRGHSCPVHASREV